MSFWPPTRGAPSSTIKSADVPVGNQSQRTVLVGVAAVSVGHGTARFLLLQELGLRDSRQGGGLVDNRGVVDLLVDGRGVVNDGGLDSLTLDNGLDCE